MLREIMLRELKRTAYHNYLQTGQRYKLTSSMISDEYVDVKGAILERVASDILVQCIAAELRSLATATPDAVAGVELGGALLAVLVAQALLRDCLVVRKVPRTHGVTVDGIDGLGNFDGGVHKLWLIEDVITTGKSALEALQRLQRCPRLSLCGVLAVVDREEGGVPEIKKAFPEIQVVALTTLQEIRQAC